MFVHHHVPAQVMKVRMLSVLMSILLNINLNINWLIIILFNKEGILSVKMYIHQHVPDHESKGAICLNVRILIID